MTTGNCNEGNLVLKVRRKNVIRFHAGSELSSSVNRMNVDVSEDRDERFETLSVQITLSKERCIKEPEKPML
jgi:hypothetical protein